MLSVKLITSGLEDLKRITKADFYLADREGDVLVNTFEQFGLEKNIITEFAHSSAESQNIKGYYFQKIRVDDSEDLILVVYANGNDGYMLSRIASSEIKHLVGIGASNMDKYELYRDVLLDNILPAEALRRSSKLKIHNNSKRVVYEVLIHEELTKQADELLKNIFSDNREDAVLTMGEGHLVIVKTVGEELDAKFENTELDEELLDNANLILSMINTELMARAKVTYGRVTSELSKLSESYKEAVMASEVVSIFYEEKEVASYTSLGIGRLIHQLPEGLCNLFLNEVLGENKDKLTEEDIVVIESFFENNLNVAETAREISINRTTLIYRLDKLVKKTGLDIRKFEDAMTLKIAMMVARYLEYKKGH